MTVVLLLVGWLVGALIGWQGYRLALSPDARFLVQQATWVAGVGLAIAVGAASHALVTRVREVDARSHLCVLTAVGWGLASVVGWSIDVQVGGPLSGVAVALLYLGIRQGGYRYTVALFLWPTILLALRLVTLGPWGSSGVVTALVVPVVVSAALTWAVLALFGAAIPERKLSVLQVAVWGIAWIGGYLVADPLAAAIGIPALTPPTLEVIVAFGIGGTLSSLVGGLGQAPPPATTQRTLIFLWWGVAAVVSAGSVLLVRATAALGITGIELLQAQSLLMAAGGLVTAAWLTRPLTRSN